eukprot:TRINITY_DN32964_c0_g1_i1.p1 TRINITY_DN32964_c0_g1~~TRINITY_DN32964_c0_g1_i1.p1  ORF type:complete len:338 (-),score=68.43 TRINITY_DN32964_c0_g1_i1:295-1308(-)
MDLLGGYGSDDEDDSNDEGIVETANPSSSRGGSSEVGVTSTPVASGSCVGIAKFGDGDMVESNADCRSSQGSPRVASNPSVGGCNSESGMKRRKVDISKLPLARPLHVPDTLSQDDGGAPLKRLAELEATRVSSGRSLIESLPPPKATLGAAGADAAFGRGSGGARIDLSGLDKPRERPREVIATEVLKSEKSLLGLDTLQEGPLPECATNHPMFNANSGGIETGDGPTLDDIEFMRKLPNFTKIAADDMKDPDWYMKNQVLGAPGLHKGKSVPTEMSNYDTKRWQDTTHANPSRIQKRKHQINWLAQEAMDNEAELLDRNASGRLTKSQTQMKYGW